jgi:hypothetical protein
MGGTTRGTTRDKPPDYGTNHPLAIFGFPNRFARRRRAVS